ncbi:MAG: ATP-binding protein, partial [Pikeienuella sp.]
DDARAAVIAAADAARAEGRAHGVAETGAGRFVFAATSAFGGRVDLLIFDAGRAPAPADAFFEQAPVALVRLDADGAIEAANQAAIALLGPDAAPGARFSDLVDGLGRPVAARIAEAISGSGCGRADLARAARRDRELYLQVAMRRAGEEPAAGVLAVISDATDMEARERQFVQSQKMQAVGQLAGGVAHDFNNLLTAILGHCDLMAMRRDEADPDFGDLTQIRQNANRAAGLVRQLLAFSRQQKLDPRACRLPEVLGDLSHLLDRLIGERVSLRVSCDDSIWPVWADQQQFEQVVLNLVVNARDAMQEGGEVRILCRNQSLEEEWRRDRAVVPMGDYVRIEIADDGTGMSEEIRAKIFEPFFTTKRAGEGTGLGLSTAYGIVKQTGGFIFVDSAPGKGTVFTLMIPRLEGAPETMRAAASPGVIDLTGAGRVLLVEDEAPVRAFASRALRLRGYEVIEAEHAEAALGILADEALCVDLVISDVMMPGRDGPDWVREARRARPDMPVIFTSGYAEDMFRKGLKGLGNCSFLAKPFSLEELGAAVKDRLPAPERAGAPEFA